MKKSKLFLTIFITISLLFSVFSINKLSAEEQNPYEWYAFAEGNGNEDSKTYYVSKDGKAKTQVYFIYDSKKNSPNASDFSQAKSLGDYSKYKKEKSNKDLLKNYLPENIRPGIENIYQRLLKVLFYIKSSTNVIQTETANKFVQKVTGAYVDLSLEQDKEYKEVISTKIPTKFSIQLYTPKTDAFRVLVSGEEDENADEEIIERSISKKLNIIEMKGVVEGQEIYLTRKKDASNLKTTLLIKENKVMLKDKNIEANNADLGINFVYKDQEKTLIATIDENIEQEEVFLGFANQSLVVEDTALENDGVLINISQMKKEIKNSKTAFKKLLENPDDKKKVEERLKGLTEALKGKILPMYHEGILISNLSVEGTEKKDNEPLEVILEKDEDKKTIINTITYKNLLPFQKYILKGQISIINEEGRNIKINEEKTKEFITPKNGQGEETLTFEDITLNSGKKYAIDVTATSVYKYEFKDGIKHHRADHEQSGDLSKTFTVKKQEIKQPQDQNDDPNIQNDQAPESNQGKLNNSQALDQDSKKEKPNNQQDNKPKEEKPNNQQDNKPKEEKQNNQKDSKTQNSEIKKEEGKQNKTQESKPNVENDPKKSNSNPKKDNQNKKPSKIAIILPVIFSILIIATIITVVIIIYKKRIKN